MRNKRGEEVYVHRKYWYDKATLCRMIEARVGTKYGKKLWNMTNIDLERILDESRLDRMKANESNEGEATEDENI